jgi:hypothetical protein
LDLKIRTGAKHPTGAKQMARHGKRELIDTGKDKRYMRRNNEGQFKESDDVGRSLAADVRKKAKTKVPAGQGDRGDQKRK